MNFKCSILDEPLLEFGDQHSHTDPRLGLIEAGPLQTYLGDAINVGIVGNSKTVEDTERFLAAATEGFPSPSATHPNLHPEFPGLSNRNPFLCRFETPVESMSTLSQSRIDRIIGEPNAAKAIELAVDAIIESLENLEETSGSPDVAIVALPVKLIERVWAYRSDSIDESPDEDAEETTTPDFRGLLKAKAMRLRFPIQIVWEDVVDENAKIPRKIKESSDRKIQDQAGRAWNLLTSLYYKGSGRIPWRRLPEEGEYKACYVGISFFRDPSGKHLWTSAAQMFDERGRGFILKGGRAQTEARGKNPFLSHEEAYSLTKRVLEAYRNHHMHPPARVIVLKTSQFKSEEASGVTAALNESSGAEYRDLIWIQESTAARIFRDGDYPVLRGTFVDLGGKGLLYTTGSIPYYGTYPGVGTPRPLLIVPHDKSDSTILQIAKEVFSLTKINWNSTQMHQRYPIPIRAARKVGEVLKYVPDGQAVSSDYRDYI